MVLYCAKSTKLLHDLRDRDIWLDVTYVYFVVAVPLCLIFVVVQVQLFVSQQSLVEVSDSFLVATLVHISKEGRSISFTTVVLIFDFKGLRQTAKPLELFLALSRKIQ